MRGIKGLAVCTMLGLVLLLSGCSGPAGAPAEVRSGEVQMELKGLQYVPRTLTVKAGTLVTFVNRDAMAHDVVQLAANEVHKKDPGFASPPLQPGDRWEMTFDTPGTYEILCTMFSHYTAGMTGRITVVE